MRAVSRVLRAAAVASLLYGCASEMRIEDIAAEYYNLGNGFYELKRFDKAIRYYELALERNPSLSAARWNLALAHIQTGEYEAAEDILVQWLQRDPGSIEARETLAIVYHGGQRREEALEILREVLALAPEDTLALNNIAMILWEMERREEAMGYLETLLEYEPSSRDVLFNLAVLCDEAGADEQAMGYAEQYLALIEAGEKDQTGDIIEASLIAARGYARREVFYQALETYERILALDAKRAEAWFEKALILLTSVEDPDLGAEALRRALELGYAETDRIRDLLSREDLLDREVVESLVEERGLLPAPEEPPDDGSRPAEERADGSEEPPKP